MIVIAVLMIFVVVGFFAVVYFIDMALFHRRSARKPTIVCLCGSCRFKAEFIAAYERETDAGKIVLSVGRFVPVDAEKLMPEAKARLDELHLRKIDLADEVLILNVAGYIGQSTRRELEYARAHGKVIRFLEETGEVT